VIGAPGEMYFNFTGGVQTFVVPQGNYTISVECYGDQGCSISMNPGGSSYTGGQSRFTTTAWATTTGVWAGDGLVYISWGMNPLLER